MSEQLLEAIVQLFAFIARLDGVSENEREKIQMMLQSHLNKEGALKYMRLFDFFCKLKLKDDSTELKEVAILAAKLKGQLTQQQKLVLITQLAQLIYSNNIFSDDEAKALNIISTELKIDEEEVRAITHFVAAENLQDFHSVNVLIIASSQKYLPSTGPHLKIEGSIDGFVAVLYLKTIKPFFLRYIGKSTIFLNQMPLEPGKVDIVPTGSTLRSNRFKAIYYSDMLTYFRPDISESPIDFRAEGVYYKFKKGRLGLRDICIHETNGNMVGIMGASGSGKSTLFNVLNGNERPSSGRVLINGIDIHRERKRIEGVIGYVPQDDLLIEELTVSKNLYYAAKLCFSTYTDQEIHELVDKTLISLGLYEIRNQKVGDPLNKIVSGGQRKRMNIGLELLREPMVLFVDEPTSGLSSRDSENIMDLLKEIALRGKLVFVIIHQPSSDIFKMFDKLLILDIGGYPIYYGNPVESVPYFREAAKLIDKNTGSCMECGNVNAEQIFNIIETRIVDEYGRQTEERKISPRLWHEFANTKRTPAVPMENMPKPRAILDIPNRMKQFALFTARDLKSKLANRQYMLINFLEAPLLAVLLAVLVRFVPSETFRSVIYSFQENVNIPAYIFIAVIVAIFMGLTVSAEEIIKDRKILKRESFLHLSKSSYLASKIILLFGLSAIQTLTFVIFGNAILGIHGMYISYWLVLFSASCFANLMGLNISAAFNSAVTIYILIPILLIPQIMLSGVVVQFDQLNPNFGSKTRVPLIGDLMVSRWAYEAIMVNQFKNNAFEKQFYDLEKQIAQADYQTIYYIPRLETMLEYSFTNQTDTTQEKKEITDYYLKTLRNEIEVQLDEFGHEKFSYLAYLYPGKLDSATHLAVRDFFTTLKRIHIGRHTKARDSKEQMIREMTASPKKTDAFNRLKNEHTNDKISMLVLDNNDKIRILEHKGRLVQQIYPVFADPSPRYFFDFGALFYAPTKYFAGTYFETLLFNLAVIWILTALLAVALYYDLLRKLLTLRDFFTPKLK
jgi:ABC-type multidrug transport system ATPase subunit